jgi:glycosidase
MMKWIHALLILCIFSPSIPAQVPMVTRIEPPNWWVGMEHHRVQLMLYGDHLEEISARFTPPGPTVRKVHPGSNPRYAFVDIEIPKGTAPGSYPLLIQSRKGRTAVPFEVRKREDPAGRHLGFDASDIMYLITPDRFANGDTTNDVVPGMTDGHAPAQPYGRHGGDIQGIIDRLDYLQDLGITALWINPLVENNSNASSYHGYAATDLYRIDPRFGTNNLYRQLVREAHARGIKIIMDHVNNHISIRHPWLADMPTPDWLNGTPENHQKVFHSKVEISDIHSDSLTKQKPALGWFTDSMPDLNQQNPFVATYLIQNTIWWMETTGLDGIREDTYPYINPAFAARWCKAVLDEYPRANIVGEVWIQDPVYLAPYQRGSYFPKPFDPHLPSVTDFGLFDAFARVFGDSASINVIFECLTKDFVYPNPLQLVTFVDNHDIRRIMHRVRGDIRRFTLALQIVLTTRGIPQIYYGTEIGMVGGRDHGTLRADFPGGFPGDTRSAFTTSGRTAREQEIFELMKTMIRIRKENKALAYGRLIHFRPVDEMYVYFRVLPDERVMVVVNNSSADRSADLWPYRHVLEGAKEIHDLKSGDVILNADSLRVPVGAWNTGIYSLKSR